MRTSERLLARLQEAGADLPPCTELRRTYRNRQAGIGAWSWFAYCPLSLADQEHERHMNLRYGSHWPMRTLLASEGFTFQELDCGGICVDPALTANDRRTTP